MKSIPILICLSALSGLFLCSCTGKKVAQSQDTATELKFPVTLPFETGIETELPVTLSQVAKEVKFIPLETKDECLLPPVIKSAIILSGHNLYLPTNNEVFQFTDEGKFVRTVARRGQGPGEFNGIRYIAADDASQQVYLMDHGKMMAYDKDGKFVKEWRFPFAWQFAALNDSTFASYIYNSSGTKEQRLLVTNTNQDTLKAFPQHDRFDTGGQSYYLWGACDKYLYKFQDQVCIKEYHNDTIFTVTSEELLPRYILQLGKYKMPVNKRFEVLKGNWGLYESSASAYLRPEIHETPAYLFIPYHSWNITDKSEVPQLAMYDKQKNQLFKVKDNAIKNDMYSQVPFYPTMRIADDVLLYYWEAADLLEIAKEDPNFREIKELKNLKADDNPVLMLVRTK